jgi:hypothetical protein
MAATKGGTTRTSKGRSKPKKPDDLTAPSIPIRDDRLVGAARGETIGVAAVRDRWGSQDAVAPVGEAIRRIRSITTEMTNALTLNYEVLAALDLLEMVCDAVWLLSFETPTPTPNPLARRIASAKVALRGSMATKGILQLAVYESLLHIEAGDPAADGTRESAPRLRFGDLESARQEEVAGNAAVALQALVAATRAPTVITTKAALRSLHPALGRRAQNATLPSEQVSWAAINALLKELGIGSERESSLSRLMRLYRSDNPI